MRVTGYPGRILGIDYGSRRVGIAVSDPMRVIAQGVATLGNDSNLAGALHSLIQEQGAVRIVVGIPYSPDGGKGSKALEVEKFIARLREIVNIEIETWDESFSSVNAHRALIETGMRRKKRQGKARIDEMAARLILQEYLDHHSTTPAQNG